MDILETTYQSKKELALWEACPSLPQAVKLLDGTLVVVRFIQPTDAPRLQVFFSRLSQDSIHKRFLHHRKELPYQQAVRLATVDQQTEVALVATHGEFQHDIIAVARYAVLQSDDCGWAEPAIVVEDRYQGRGLGVLLLKWLSAYAQSHAIRAFRATVHPANTTILRLIEHSQLPVEKKFESGTLDITIRLEPNLDHLQIRTITLPDMQGWPYSCCFFSPQA